MSSAMTIFSTYICLQEPDHGSKEGDHAQLPSSEPRIGAHVLHCVQEH